jgi:hypothetical protein
MEQDYPRSLAGVMASYVAGLPFFRNTAMADLIGTAVLFSLGAALARVRQAFFPPVPALQSAESAATS